ncbi:MAG: sulfite exporter TauE/SafE family protein [Planctomycetes bacterium]|jgi:ABC-type nickel/cobalt efflux system permease component RcnA|nr:sulfite exporter TauE/SafE family protein [Planctomycetota bacterium]
MIIAAINLWNPTGMGIGVLAILLIAFLLGMVHGITPDEHTWPITFSYAIGSYSWKGGMRAGLLFSLAFTLQRAIACELAYVAYAAAQSVFHDPRFNFWIYLIVGTVMVVSGLYILRRGKIPHLFHSHKMLHAEGAANPRALPRYMPLVHGFIAGWGTGAFAMIVYFALAPHMGSPWVAFLPGIAFGLGTTLMQVLLGGLFGQWMARRKLSDQARVWMARLMSGRTLAWGGIGFALVGIFGVLDPRIGGWQISTGIKVHNLAHLGLGFFLAVVMLFTVAGLAFYRSLRDVSRMKPPPSDPSVAPDTCDHGHAHSHSPAS